MILGVSGMPYFARRGFFNFNTGYRYSCFLIFFSTPAFGSRKL